MNSETPRALPAGTCWCGCGADVGRRAFFARGHDKVAEGALLAAKYGGEVAQLLLDHGFGPEPEKSVTAAAVSVGAWERCPVSGCGYPGTPESVRSHRRKVSH
ncbi:hypothetical protein [Cellulomonas sp. ES6]|uniref:hypothetical protein n=1 Tax=Cellulomonas sp. ES6 TaxID=3039384 RepID=UPI0024B68D01|nr:hypothetical protein [Cellulomonas sp. ES6]WHP16581.1 hypothetical protein P9841_13280 [Cellulomonas sp. ES6]